jgi:pimeloyl-ACP methyl ester carboxylesterase
MREPFARLSERFHVYAPDLLGYGLSARPDIDYTPALYVEFIEEILREVVQRPASVLASSLTAAHAIEAAYSSREWIETLVLVCPTGVRSLTEQSQGGKAVETLLRLPVVGQTLYYGIASRSGIRYFLQKEVYHDPARVTDEMVDAYYARSHVPGAKYAPAAFVSGKLYWDATEAWRRLEQRVLIVWGKEAAITPVSDAAAFLATNPAADLEEIAGASILPHDEQPEQFANIVAGWLSR